jgi:hypothetical protein
MVSICPIHLQQLNGIVISLCHIQFKLKIKTVLDTFAYVEIYIMDNTRTHTCCCNPII